MAAENELKVREEGSKKRRVTSFPLRILLVWAKDILRILSAFVKISRTSWADNESMEIYDLFESADLELIRIGEKKPPLPGGGLVSVIFNDLLYPH